MTNRRFTLVAAAVLAFAAGIRLRWVLEDAHRTADAPARNGTTSLLTVAFSGEDLGTLEPCGCTPAMLGGLARRPARVRASAQPGVPSALVSGGMAVAGSDDYDRLRLGVILRALGRMECAAFAPSRRELALGIDAVARAASDAGVALVAANVDAPAAPPGLLRRYVPLRATDAAAYVTGLCAPEGEVRDGIAVTDPRAALRRLRDELPAGAALVVLANVDETTARALAAADAGPTVILRTAGRTDPFDADVTNGRVAGAPLPAKGKFVGLAHLVAAADGLSWRVEYRPVVPELAEDEGVAALRTAHLQELLAADVVRAHSGDARFAVGAPAAAEDRYVGSEACAPCHEADVRAWAGSRHAKAIESLRATGDDADPACVRCHVVGYGTGRGFAAADTAAPLGAVGCESCHGARGRHADERAAGRADERAPAASERTCLACHDGEHDPQFDWAPRWQAIEHGAK